MIKRHGGKLIATAIYMTLMTCFALYILFLYSNPSIDVLIGQLLDEYWPLLIMGFLWFIALPICFVVWVLVCRESPGDCYD